MGAINGALLAGNPPKQRIERLRAFWDCVSSGVSIKAPPFFSALHHGFARASAALGSVVGVPGFFVPRVPPPAFMPDSAPGALSVYDVDPLRTPWILADFLIKRRDAPQRRHCRVRTGPLISIIQTRIARSTCWRAARCARVSPSRSTALLLGWRHVPTPLYAVDHSPSVNVLIVRSTWLRRGTCSLGQGHGRHERHHVLSSGRASMRLAKIQRRPRRSAACCKTPPRIQDRSRHQDAQRWQPGTHRYRAFDQSTLQLRRVLKD